MQSDPSVVCTDHPLQLETHFVHVSNVKCDYYSMKPRRLMITLMIISLAHSSVLEGWGEWRWVSAVEILDSAFRAVSPVQHFHTVMHWTLSGLPLFVSRVVWQQLSVRCRQVAVPVCLSEHLWDMESVGVENVSRHCCYSVTDDLHWQ